MIIKKKLGCWLYLVVCGSRGAPAGRIHGLRLCGIAMPCLADLQFIFYNFVFHFLFLISQRKFDCRPKMCAQVRPPATTTRAWRFCGVRVSGEEGPSRTPSLAALCSASLFIVFPGANSQRTDSPAP
jgi:hypothetical protein